MDNKLFRSIIKLFLSEKYILATYYDQNESYFWNNSEDLMLIAYGFKQIPISSKLRQEYEIFLERKKIENETNGDVPDRRYSTTLSLYSNETANYKKSTNNEDSKDYQENQVVAILDQRPVFIHKWHDSIGNDTPHEKASKHMESVEITYKSQKHDESDNDEFNTVDFKSFFMNSQKGNFNIYSKNLNSFENS